MQSEGATSQQGGRNEVGVVVTRGCVPTGRQELRQGSMYVGGTLGFTGTCTDLSVIFLTTPSASLLLVKRRGYWVVKVLAIYVVSHRGNEPHVLPFGQNWEEPPELGVRKTSYKVNVSVITSSVRMGTLKSETQTSRTAYILLEHHSTVDRISSAPGSTGWIPPLKTKGCAEQRILLWFACYDLYES